jgi:hypothetical protein
VADASTTWVEQELGPLIDALELDDQDRLFMRSRWLNQVTWLERKAKDNQKRYYALRVISIVGGIVVPALVSVNVTGDARTALSWTTFAVSLAVALAVAIEGFFHYGDRWRHYRRTVELLKSHGWQLFELAGAYATFGTHREAFRSFASTVEGLIVEDVEVYLNRVVREKPKEDASGAEAAGAGKPQEG